MTFFLSIYLIGVLLTMVHLFRMPALERTKSKVIEVVLLYQIVFSLGITSFVAFIGLSLMPEMIAHYLNWAYCPFEQELANVNLAFGVLGVMSIWYRGLFWMATIYGFSIWILADGFHHIYEYLYHGNDSSGNIGVPLITDFVVPIILLVLFYYYRKDQISTPSVF